MNKAHGQEWLCHKKLLWEDDPGLLTLKFRGLGELAPKKFDEAVRARASIGAQQTHPVKKNQKHKNFGVFNGDITCAACLRLLCFGEECGERGVKLAGKSRIRGLFVIDARAESLVGFGESLQGGENIGVARGGLRGAELRDGERNPREQDLIGIDDFLREFGIEEQSVDRDRTLVLVFVALRGDQMRAIQGAIDGHFTLGSAADGANFLALGGAISSRFALFADRTRHGVSFEDENEKSEYAAGIE